MTNTDDMRREWRGRGRGMYNATGNSEPRTRYERVCEGVSRGAIGPLNDWKVPIVPECQRVYILSKKINGIHIKPLVRHPALPIPSK
jgi:hypothetical protein